MLHYFLLILGKGPPDEKNPELFKKGIMFGKYALLLFFLSMTLYKVYFPLTALFLFSWITSIIGFNGFCIGKLYFYYKKRGYAVPQDRYDISDSFQKVVYFFLTITITIFSFVFPIVVKNLNF